MMIAENLPEYISSLKSGLPELVGEPHEIVFAEQIREKVFSEKEEYLAGKSGEVERLIEGVIDRLKGITSAKWWCEHKLYSLELLIKLMT
jgi:hypothetical protein